MDPKKTGWVLGCLVGATRATEGAVRACLVEVIKAWEFPPAPEGEIPKCYEEYYAQFIDGWIRSRTPLEYVVLIGTERLPGNPKLSVTSYAAEKPCFRGRTFNLIGENEMGELLIRTMIDTVRKIAAEEKSRGQPRKK